MRVALVSKAIYPVRGGVELHVHNLAHELSRLGHQVHAFTSSGEAHEFRPNGYTVTAGVNPRKLYPALGDFDVVHAHGARTPIAAWALIAAKRLGKRTVFTPHCFYPAQHWPGRIKRALFDPTLGRYSLRRADHVICLTENDRDDALKLGATPGQVRIIPNSVRLPGSPDADQVTSFRKRYGLGKFILSVGRLDRVKRGDFLISAVPLLPPELDLVFIGPDAGCLNSWRHYAESLAVARRVHFLQDVSDEDLLLAYRASTAVVMASSYEGLPTVLLEAMAIGTPVIAGSTGGIRYLLQHRVNGLLYECGDMEGFCANVRHCVEETPAEMIARAREHVHKHYSWEINAGRVAALYEGRES